MSRRCFTEECFCGLVTVLFWQRFTGCRQSSQRFLYHKRMTLESCDQRAYAARGPLHAHTQEANPHPLPESYTFRFDRFSFSFSVQNLEITYTLTKYPHSAWLPLVCHSIHLVSFLFSVQLGRKLIHSPNYGKPDHTHAHFLIR